MPVRPVFQLKYATIFIGAGSNLSCSKENLLEVTCSDLKLSSNLTTESSLFYSFGWKKVKALYMRDAYDHVSGPKTCYQMIDTISDLGYNIYLRAFRLVEENFHYPMFYAIVGFSSLTHRLLVTLANLQDGQAQR